MLREMNFGAQEGLHFDGLSKAEKERISSPTFQAEGGENWDDVLLRVETYFSTIGVGNHLIFLHGGPMAICLSKFGVTKMPTNCSIAGVTFD